MPLNYIATLPLPLPRTPYSFTSQLGPEEVEKIIDETISRLGATSIKDMGKVMNELKTTLAGE